MSKFDVIRPWYRQFWPWFLIAIPLAGVVTASITATCAFTHPDPEVPHENVAPLDKTSWESRHSALGVAQPRPHDA